MTLPDRPNPSGKSNADHRPVPLLDLSRENSPLRAELLAAFAEVLDSTRYVLGPQVTALEQELAHYCGVKHAIACASGSDALLLALMACDIGPGDEVIVPSFTFFATASAVWRLGATPVFVDIEPGSFAMDPRCVERAITPATKAIIPVHLFGLCADLRTICDLAQQLGLRVIEDCAQSIGAAVDGRKCGGWGEIGCLSFYPTKNLGGFGDGGALTTHDDALADRLRLLAAHGMRPRYHHHVVGINSRLDSLQAAALRVKLRHLEKWNDQRRENAATYHRLFAAAGLQHAIALPGETSHHRHVWNQYTIRVAGGLRDRLRGRLAERGIGSEVYYPIPLHQQECFRSMGFTRGSLPETERAAAEVLSLPIFPELSIAEQQTVVSQIADGLSALGHAAIRAA
jgi:dTDP-4-amino-4,6-dideoxygalactose transaminase